MSFETELKKLQKMWDAGQDNYLAFQQAQLVQSMIEYNKADLLSNNITINSINDIGRNYINSEVLMIDPYQVSAFIWTISKTLPEIWIPMIRIGISYNFTGAQNAFDNVSSYYNKILSVVSTEQESIVTATWQIGVYFVSYFPSQVLPSFQAKLNFVLVDPNTAS